MTVALLLLVPLFNLPLPDSKSTRDIFALTNQAPEYQQSNESGLSSALRDWPSKNTWTFKYKEISKNVEILLFRVLEERKEALS